MATGISVPNCPKPGVAATPANTQKGRRASTPCKPCPWGGITVPPPANPDEGTGSEQVDGRASQKLGPRLETT